MTDPNEFRNLDEAVEAGARRFKTRLRAGLVKKAESEGRDIEVTEFGPESAAYIEDSVEYDMQTQSQIATNAEQRAAMERNVDHADRLVKMQETMLVIHERIAVAMETIADHITTNTRE